MKHLSFLRAAGLLAGLLLVLAPPVAAQAPAWQSARAITAATMAATSNNLAVTATAVDAAGNVFLAGSFTSTVVLGSTTLTTLGGYDIFVAKFNPTSNQFVWAQRAGGTNGDYATALAVSGTGVYVAGYFSSPTTGFGPITLANAGGGVGNNDAFIAKITDLGSAGSFAWAQRAGGTGDDTAYALAVSGTSVYVAGGFGSSSVGFGPTTLTNADVATGSWDVFVAKITDAGSASSFTWAQRAGGTDFDFVTALAISGTGLYVAGNFSSSTAGFGAVALTSAGSTDVFVAKLTDAGSTGSFAWAQRAGGTGIDRVNALAASGTSVYVAGYFGSSTMGLGSTTLTNAGYYDIFVAKLTDAGNTGSFGWAQRAGGIGEEAVTALAVSGTNVYVAGYFDNPITNFGSTTLASAGSYDAFIAKLTDVGSTGSFVWAKRAGGARFDDALALTVSGLSVYVAGVFDSPTAEFDTVILSNPNPGYTLGFLASLTDPTLTATATAGPREPAALFPNPARRTATLRLPAGTPGAPLTLADALGRAVRRYPAPAGPETALDLGGLPAGLYLLRGAGPARRLAVE